MNFLVGGLSFPLMISSILIFARSGKARRASICPMGPCDITQFSRNVHSSFSVAEVSKLAVAIIDRACNH